MGFYSCFKSWFSLLWLLFIVSIVFFMSLNVAVLYCSWGVNFRTTQPRAAASLNLAISAIYPCALLCRPYVQTPPSISMAILYCGMAKSNRHRLSGWNLYSLTHSTPKSVLHITVKTSLICVLFAVCRLFFVFLITCLSIVRKTLVRAWNTPSRQNGSM